MKFNFKKNIPFFLMCLPAIAHAQAGKFTISGEVYRLRADSAVLKYTTPGVGKKVISVPVKNGKFQFSGLVEEPLSAALTLKIANGANSQDRLWVYLDPGKTWIHVVGSTTKGTFGGTKLNDEFFAFQKEDRRINARYDSLEAVTSHVSDSERSSERFKLSQKAKEKEIDNALINAKREFAEQHLNSVVGILALQDYAYYVNYPEVKTIFSNFSTRAKNSIEGKNFAAKLEKMRSTAIGATAPDFAEPDTAGTMITLSSFRGKYVLVDFWASWCVPCRQENPNVVKAYHEFKDKGFTIIGVSMDGPKDKNRWLKAIHDDHLAWTQVSALKFMNGPAAIAYGVEAIPQNVLLDPSGKIIGKNLRGDELTNKLKDILR